MTRGESSVRNKKRRSFWPRLSSFKPALRLRLACDRLAECGLRRGEPRDRHAVGRAGDVVEADVVAEGDGGGIATVLAADADLELRAGLAAARDADLDELADAFLVKRDEGIDRKDA